MVSDLSLLLTLSGSNGLLMSFLSSLLGCFVGCSFLLGGVCQLLDISFSSSLQGCLLIPCLLLCLCNFVCCSFLGGLTLLAEVFDLLSGGLLCCLGFGFMLLGSLQPLLIKSSLCLESLFLLLDLLSVIFGLL